MWVEQTLIRIWQQLLGRAVVGRNENFLDIGGHSLLATQLITRIRQQLGVDIPLYAIFKAPTLAALAALVETYGQMERGYRVPDIQPMTHGILLPLSHTQQRIWHADQQNPRGATHHPASMLHMRGKIDIDRLEQSLKKIVQRHETLRTVFLSIEGSPVQMVLATMASPLDLVDLTHIAPELQEQAVEQFVQEHRRHPFNLAQGPLLRAHLLQIDPHHAVLCLTIHPIVADGWSHGIFMRELAAHYNASISGQPAIVPHLAIQYGDFIAWQCDWMDTTVLQSQIQFWKKRLVGVPAPLGYPRPAAQTVIASQQMFTVPMQVLQKLQRLSRHEGVTLYMTLLAAWQVLLHSYSQQEQIAVGTQIANRERAEIEDLIGPFDNTLIMVSELVDDQAFKDVLQQVRQVCLDAYTHQHVSLEQIAQEIQPRHTPGITALLQAMFILQSAPLTSTAFEGLEVEVMPLYTDSKGSDLTLSLMETQQGLLGTLGYNSALFEPSTIASIITDYQRLLEHIVLDITQSIGALTHGQAAQPLRNTRIDVNVAPDLEMTGCSAISPQFSTELPVDYAGGANTIESTERATVALTPGETHALLETIQDVYRTQVHDILLTALALTLMLWRNQEAVTISLAHGTYPVHLDLTGCHSLAQAIKLVKEQLHQQADQKPARSQRCCSATGMANTDMIGPARPTLHFSYLERSAWSQGEASEPIPSSTAYYRSTHHQQGQRAYLLEIISLVTDDRIHFTWSYSRNCYDAATIQELAAEFIHTLREILNHCQQPQAGGVTPSDFPLARLTQEQLDQRIDMPRQVEDICPLTVRQQKKLFHAPSTSITDSIMQVSMLFERGFDVCAFQQAWDQVIQSQPILRSSFLWEGLPESQQIVYRDIFLPTIQQDWRHLTAAQQQKQFMHYQQTDREQDFSYEQAPLMRIFIAQLDTERYAVLWSYHQLLLNDRHRSLILKQLFTGYMEYLQQCKPEQIIHNDRLHIENAFAGNSVAAWQLV
ncbi:hypothetical protein KDH_08100 [Dictyobacter sp. S3.2.2.5]|uniref:Carrier domain-containing protein n=2 Tax=Dictyobacter halimunensis TaxID=3026934 RepID=A0ABQ6FNK8_9CHLR|nr:hypothetical protein KDH_08100 [Dictyobacter sp. S3.2.2.5]